MTYSMEHQSRNKDIGDVLQRTVSSHFPDIDTETIINAMDKNEFSWNMMRRESEENVVERLQSIDGLNRIQCLELYRVIKGSDPKVMEVEMRKSLYNVYNIFYKKFLMRRMYPLSVHDVFSIHYSLTLYHHSESRGR